MKNKRIKAICTDAILLALLIVCSQISVPVGLLKFTLQLLIVYLIANVCSLKDGLLIIISYILLGLFGVPVFASFGSGFSYIISPTFGFVYGFIAVILINNLLNKLLSKMYIDDIVKFMLSSVVSTIVLYVIGFIHGEITLNIINGKGLSYDALLNMMILPYIPFDFLKLCLASVLSVALKGTFDSKKIHYQRIDSTSTYLKNNYKKYDNLTFVSASYQENGKGRMNRKWISNTNENLMFSFLIKDKKLIEDYSSISLLIATSIYKVLKSLDVKNVSIKWPNDVYVNNKKICGILLESVANGSSIDCLVVGVGLNLNTKSFDNQTVIKTGLFDSSNRNIKLRIKNNFVENNEDISSKATSFYIETHRNISVNKVYKMVHSQILNDLQKLIDQKSSYLEIVRNNNYLLNKLVYCDYKNERAQALVIGINDDNSLKIMLNGVIKNVRTGEITFH